jgi:valyl-tRNA synthetase
MTSDRTDELPARYDPESTEPAIYAAWVDAGCFTAQAERSTRVGGDREPFAIVMPPPNVTDILHVGHGLDNITQDVLIRWARMRGAETLWAPGTDHAGIATQNVVERLLAKEGKTRFDVGREAFVRRTERFVEETGGTILRQLRAIGASADWTRTAYTLSPELSRAVREAFVRLYEAGLIFKGHRVIHWCPRCLTSLSDEEAEFEDEVGTLYHVAYPVAGQPDRKLVVATTRPETMLGDVAVAVNPADARYADIVGSHVVLPIVGAEIPIVADEYADPAFGTGVVKITPAHDANDFEVGKRHNLPMPVVIDEHARMAEVSHAAGRVPAELRGLDRFAARERIVQMLRSSGALVKTEPHQHAVRHCYRCHTVIEPRLSEQWFVRMAPLAQPALEAVGTGAIRILPERWEGVYVHWLENIRDWNISRQLWWGHRIPVWYCDDCDPPNDLVVSRDDVTSCPNCGGAVRQDEDVLDTWFSSWLWPLTTLGWPDTEHPDFRAFYPTDILFFWVSRMIMAGYFFAGRAPYHTVYLHGIARDTQHRKMSKSLGNGIDPLVVVKLFGGDALRWTLVSGMGLGTDVILDPDELEKSFASGRNFATKLWNIGRFLLTNIGNDPVRSIGELDSSLFTRADHWVLSRLDTAIAEADTALGPLRPMTAAPGTVDGRVWRDEERRVGMRLSDLAETARRFVWNELADWYLEAIKGRLGGEGDDREVARSVLVHVVDGALRLLHPVVPFISEALWQRLPGRVPGQFLVRAAWPTPIAIADRVRAAEFELVRETVVALRQLRAEYNLPAGKTIDAVVVAAPGTAGAFSDEAGVFTRLARANVRVVAAAPTEAAAHSVLSGGSALAVPLAGLIDVTKECARLRHELAGLEKQLTALERRLADDKFTARAPAHVVEAERAKLAEWTARRRQLSDKVRTLCGA